MSNEHPSEKEKRRLKSELSKIVDSLQIEERPVEDLMNFVGTHNASHYWRFTNESEVKQALISKINEILE